MSWQATGRVEQRSRCSSSREKQDRRNQAEEPLVTFHLHIVLELVGLGEASQKSTCWRSGREKGWWQEVKPRTSVAHTAVASFAARVGSGSPRVRKECVNIHNSKHLCGEPPHLLLSRVRSTGELEEPLLDGGNEDNRRTFSQPAERNKAANLFSMKPEESTVGKKRVIPAVSSSLLCLSGAVQSVTEPVSLSLALSDWKCVAFLLKCWEDPEVEQICPSEINERGHSSQLIYLVQGPRCNLFG